MEQKMLALVKTASGEGNMELREVSIPTPAEGQVLVNVKATGICGSDIHIYHSDIALAMRTPVITGHEFSGVVEKVGPGVKRVKPGDRVSAETAFYSCGQCLNCKRGRTNICPEKKLIGYWFNGAFTNYVVIPEKNIHFLPENIGFHEGAMMEPLCSTIEAVVERTGIEPEDVVVISGPGVIGLLAVQLVKLYGGRVIVTGTAQDKKRLEMAVKLGADYVVEIGKDNLEELVIDITNGEGADVVLECSGAPMAARTGLQLVRRRGKYTQMGLFSKPFEIDFALIAYKEIQVTGSLGQQWVNWNLALKLLKNNRLDLKSLISHVLPLNQWQEAFRMVEKAEGFKILLEPANICDHAHK